MLQNTTNTNNNKVVVMKRQQRQQQRGSSCNGNNNNNNNTGGPASEVENLGRDAVRGGRDGEHRRRVQALPGHEQPETAGRNRAGKQAKQSKKREASAVQCSAVLSYVMYIVVVVYSRLCLQYLFCICCFINFFIYLIY